MFGKTFVILAVALLGAAQADVKPMGRTVVPIPDGRIVGGEAADISQYPHQISMRYKGSHRCGGSIYSASIIVSAAHCVVGIEDATLLSIVAGSTFLDVKQQELQVVKYVTHKGYNSFNNDNDVALLLVNGQFQLNANVQPIALASQRPPVDSSVTVTGWGTLVEGAGTVPNELQKVDVLVRDNTDCKTAYKQLLTSRMICASVEGGGKDACQGDSGGPLISGNELVGIVSWGVGCARPNYPGVYASVAELRDWIIDTAKDL